MIPAGGGVPQPRVTVAMAASSGDPYLAPFVGEGRLAECFVVLPRGRGPRLGYFSPMEREEAAAADLPLLTPEQLDILRWTRDGTSPDELWANVLSRALHLCEVSPGEVAVAGSLSAGVVSGCLGRLAAEGWRAVPGEPWLDQSRKTKSHRDLDHLRRFAAAGTCDAFRRLAEILRSAEPTEDALIGPSGRPLTVGDLRREAGLAFTRHGLECPSRCILAPGDEGAVPHNTGNDARRLRPGESLVVDLYPRGRLYADCTRTFCVGRPPEALVRAHRHVSAALDLAESSAVPGAWGWDLQEEVCEYLARAGYETPITHRGNTRGYVHGLGHGVGFELHELPSFRENVPLHEGRLAVGDVLTLEPGLYDPEAGWAVRLENQYVLGPDGLENLTPLPRDLDPGAW